MQHLGLLVDPADADAVWPVWPGSSVEEQEEEEARARVTPDDDDDDDDDDAEQADAGGSRAAGGCVRYKRTFGVLQAQKRETS